MIFKINIIIIQIKRLLYNRINSIIILFSINFIKLFNILIKKNIYLYNKNFLFNSVSSLVENYMFGNFIKAFTGISKFEKALDNCLTDNHEYFPQQDIILIR